MRRRRSRVLALAVVAALSCTGCVKAGGFRTGEDKARDEAREFALEDAEKVAVEVERRQFPQGGGLFYATGSATGCVRFEIHGDNGPRRVTTREIDCPP
jgi:hypothetical protein